MSKKRKIKPRRPWPGGAGGPEVWRKLAEARIGAAHARNDDLSALGLTVMPSDIQDLKRAYRKAMMSAHPDQGGTDEDAIKTSLAYARLLQAMKGQS